jgi:hypothetical protein
MRTTRKPVTRTRSAATEPAGELTTTLNTLALFQGAIQHADDKARTVVAIQTMLTAMVAAQLTFLVDPNPTSSVKVARLVILAIFVPGYLQSSYHLLRAVIPRMAPTSGRNQFAFPSIAVDYPSPIRVWPRNQHVQAREVGRALANLAMVKHRHVRRAMYGTCALFTSALGSLVIAVVS